MHIVNEGAKVKTVIHFSEIIQVRKMWNNIFKSTKWEKKINLEFCTQ